jgi:site-specific recombinase XerD
MGAVTYFSELLGEKQDLSQITGNDLRRFIIEFGERPGYRKHPSKPERKEPISPISVQTYARTIMAFFEHIAAEELIPINPMQRVKIPKVQTRAVPTFSASEVERLLRTPDKNTPTGFRDYAMMLTFIDTGQARRDMQPARKRCGYRERVSPGDAQGQQGGFRPYSVKVEPRAD